MPRMPPVRQLDMNITETVDARPVSMRHYPVAPQHMPELERQIKALLDAGIIRESVSLYASPVLFAPKKDGNLRLCVDYRRLNRQTLRNCYQHQSHLISLQELEGHAYFRSWIRNQASTSCAYVKVINTKPRLPLQVVNMNGSLVPSV